MTVCGGGQITDLEAGLGTAHDGCDSICDGQTTNLGAGLRAVHDGVTAGKPSTCLAYGPCAPGGSHHVSPLPTYNHTLSVRSTVNTLLIQSTVSSGEAEVRVIEMSAITHVLVG